VGEGFVAQFRLRFLDRLVRSGEVLRQTQRLNLTKMAVLILGLLGCDPLKDLDRLYVLLLVMMPPAALQQDLGMVVAQLRLRFFDRLVRSRELLANSQGNNPPKKRVLILGLLGCDSLKDLGRLYVLLLLIMPPAALQPNLGMVLAQLRLRFFDRLVSTGEVLPEPEVLDPPHV